MTSDGGPPAYPPENPPPGNAQPYQAPQYPPQVPGQFPGQFPGQQSFGQQFGGPAANQPWTPAPGYQPPPIVNLGGSIRPPRSRGPARIIFGAIGVIVLLLIVAGIIGAVTKSKNADTTVVVPSITFTIPSFAITPSALSGSAGKNASAAGKLGSTITLNGQSAGEKLDVTLLKIAPTTTATDGFSTPPKGDRYFAAQFRLTNTGSASYTDAADNDAEALDAQGKQFDTDIVGSIAAGPLFGDQLNIAPGASVSGWIVFDVPTTTTVASVQFTTDSGFGDAAEWAVT